jgi:hypothetical protein
MYCRDRDKHLDALTIISLMYFRDHIAHVIVHMLNKQLMSLTIICLPVMYFKDHLAHLIVHMLNKQWEGLTKYA